MSETLTDFVENLQEEDSQQAEIVENAFRRSVSYVGGKVKDTIVNDLSSHGKNVSGVFHLGSRKKEADSVF